jgi:hypothetical protein
LAISEMEASGLIVRTFDVITSATFIGTPLSKYVNTLDPADRFGYPGLPDYPVRITGMDDLTIAFGDSSQPGDVGQNMNESIDRVTWDVGAPQRSWARQGSRQRARSNASQCMNEP